MGLLQKTTIGMEISHDGVAAVLLCKKADRPLLQRATRTTLAAGTVQHSLKEPQILNQTAFIHAFREAWGSLHISRRQVALSLPDSAGLLMLKTIDEPWKTRDEAADMIRWKSGKRLGIAPELLHLDFQVLERNQDGQTSLLVALMHRTVIQQYEELVLEAGLQPTQIGFHSLHLLRLLDRLPAADTGQIITFYDNVLGICALSDNKPVFHRIKQLTAGSGQPLLLRHELAASLAACRHAYGGSLPGRCHAMTYPHDRLFATLLTELYSTPSDMVSLEALVERDAELSLSSDQLYQASAAIGAALGGA